MSRNAASTVDSNLDNICGVFFPSEAGHSPGTFPGEPHLQTVDRFLEVRHPPTPDRRSESVQLSKYDLAVGGRQLLFLRGVVSPQWETELPAVALLTSSPSPGVPQHPGAISVKYPGCGDAVDYFKEIRCAPKPLPPRSPLNTSNCAPFKPPGDAGRP